MPITDPLILPVDVVITPVSALAPAVRARLGAKDSDYAVTRPRGRTVAKLVSAEAAGLLEEFREPRRVAEAIRGHAGRLGKDPELLLSQAFPLLRDCFDGRFLVPFDSPDAARILPTRERGDRIGGFTLLRSIQVLEDTELYQARGPDGALAAIKLVRPGARRETVLGVSREAATLRHLQGAGVPVLLARGRHRGRSWLAIDWCRGVTPDVACGELRGRSSSEGAQRLLRLVVGVARGYAGLHQRGIIHGDVHPKNLLIGRDDAVTILDFGLARTVPPLRLGGSAGCGAVALYIPPEYARAELAGCRWPAPTRSSEQYALAALLYRLLTGRPYAEFGLDRKEMLTQIANAPPLPFASRQVAPWPAVEAILARALSKQAEDRYPSVQDMVNALEGAWEGAPTSTVVPQGGAGSEADALLEDFLTRADFDGPDFPGNPAARPVPPTASVMHGSAGVAYALYRLACQRDEARLLSLADAWLARTEAVIASPTAFDAPGTSLDRALLGPVSPFHSVTGVHLVRALIAQAQGDRRASTAAAIRFVGASGTAWEGLDLTLGRAGVLLGCAVLLEALPPEWNKAVRRVRELGTETLDWLWTALDRSGPVPASRELDNLGVAHGWAGVLFATLRWSRCTGAVPPAQVVRRLDELAAAAEPLGRGVHWHQNREAMRSDGESSGEIPGWCNGPAGFIHLWTLAHDFVGGGGYLGLAESAAWSAFEARTRNPTLCCGLTGQAYGVLNLYKRTGDAEWLARARTLAGRAAAIARHVKYAPDRPLSLFTGRTGIALLAADLASPETAVMPFFEHEGWPEPVRNG